jgi:small GTP-binding protein
MFSLIQNSMPMGLYSNSNKKAPTTKISIIGTPAVGKSTLKKLLCDQKISGRYVPTQGFDLGKTSVDGVNFNIWDFGGQKQYIKAQMSQYIHGSDIIFVVSDSTPVNVLTTKELLDYTRELVDDESCEIIAIANKQDLTGHMEPNRIQDVLRIPTFGMVATENVNRDNMVELIQSLIRKVESRKGN